MNWLPTLWLALPPWLSCSPFISFHHANGASLAFIDAKYWDSSLFPHDLPAWLLGCQCHACHPLPWQVVDEKAHSERTLLLTVKELEARLLAVEAERRTAVSRSLMSIRCGVVATLIVPFQRCHRATTAVCDVLHVVLAC